MQQDLVLERSDRLAEARAWFGQEVRLSEPFAGRPPLWVEPASEALRTDPMAAVRWAAENHDAIERVLLTFGAVLCRGFAVRETADFADFMGSFEVYSKGYTAGTSERQAIKGAVMESTRTPDHVYILLHQEMSYLPDTPRALAFYCKSPSETGGETVICDMRGLLEALPEDLTTRFVERGVRYVRNMRNRDVEDFRADPVRHHPSWQDRFDTTDRSLVEQQLSERGAAFRWEDDGSLTFWTELPGTINHPVTGERLFFNQMVAQTKHRVMFGGDHASLDDAAYGDSIVKPHFITFGTGESLTDDEFMTVHKEFERRKVAFAWQAGDVMILENKFTAHGRHPFTGERDIQVMLLQ
jgi:alpha-ketoglutarate-dependent taurine dioxygenase